MNLVFSLSYVSAYTWRIASAIRVISLSVLVGEAYCWLLTIGVVIHLVLWTVQTFFNTHPPIPLLLVLISLVVNKLFI